MFKLDEDILRCYLRLEEYERQRLWMERLLHPEKFKWAKRGAPPKMTETKKIRIEELAKMGFGEEHYQRMCHGEQAARAELVALVEAHPLWVHFTHLNSFAHKLAGGFIAAGGDIQRPSTVSSFWKGMGLDVLPDGTVPRRIRGRKVERKMPALPHVTRAGELIRQQINRSPGQLHNRYLYYKGIYVEKRPEKKLIFNHKAGLRIAQKQLYACLWSEWRQAYGLPAPWPYAFDILHHNGRPLTIVDLYDK